MKQLSHFWDTPLAFEAWYLLFAAHNIALKVASAKIKYCIPSPPSFEHFLKQEQLLGKVAMTIISTAKLAQNLKLNATSLISEFKELYSPATAFAFKLRSCQVHSII